MCGMYQAVGKNGPQGMAPSENLRQNLLVSDSAKVRPVTS